MTLAQPETTERAFAPAPRRPPPLSRRAKWAYAVVVMAAVLTAGGVLWLGTYQPLIGASSYGSYGAGLVEPAGGYEAVSLVNVFGEERRVVEPRPGDELGMDIALENDGPLGVTIISITQPFNPSGTVGSGEHPDTTSAGHLMRANHPFEQDWVDFEPFELAAGEYAQLRMTFTVLDCATELTAPGGADIVTTVPVTYRVLGTTHTVDLDLGYALSIESLPHCPYPASSDHPSTVS